MESNKVAKETLEGKKEMSGFPVQEGEEEAAMAPAASPATILARPLLLLRHVAHGCAGYLAGLASRLKPAPAAAACQPLPRQEEEGKIQAAAVVIVSAQIKPPFFLFFFCCADCKLLERIDVDFSSLDYI